MKTFIIQGCNWYTEIEIDDNLIEKELEMGCEAATQAMEKYLANGKLHFSTNEIISTNEAEPALGPFMLVHEKGWSNDPDKEMIFLTEHICRNAGKHALADTVSDLVLKHYKGL